MTAERPLLLGIMKAIRQGNQANLDVLLDELEGHDPARALKIRNELFRAKLQSHRGTL